MTKHYKEKTNKTLSIPLSHPQVFQDARAIRTCELWLSGKESTCNVRDPGSIPGLVRSPGGGHSNPTPVFLPGGFPLQRGLAGSSPWGCKELDTTE